MILLQTANRLANVFQRHCKNPTLASQEAKEIIDDLYEALGGCDVCFGKGYNLIGEAYEYCDCNRGKALEKFVDSWSLRRAPEAESRRLWATAWGRVIKHVMQGKGIGVWQER